MRLTASRTMRNPPVAEGRRLQPNLTVKWLVEHAPNIPPLFEGLRKAGAQG